MKRALLLVIIYLGFVSLGLPDGVLGLAWPGMRASLGEPLEALGLVTFILATCSAISGFVSGRVLARFGTGIVAFASALTTGLSLLALSHVPNFPVMVLLAFPLGFGAGSVDAGLNHFVAEHYSSRHMNWLHACWGIGATVGPLVFGTILKVGGNWSTGYVAISSFQLTLATILFFSLGLWSIQWTAHADPHKVALGEGGQTPKWAQILAPVLFACYVAVEMGVGLWAASIFIESRHFDAGTAGFALTSFYGSITGGRVIIGFVSEKIGNRRLIRGGLALALVGIVLMVIPGSLVLSFAGLMLFGLGCAPIYPSMMHETPRRFDPPTARKVIGWQVGAANLGGATMPALFGVLAANFGLEAVFPVIGGFVVVMLVLISLLDRATQRP